MKLDGAQFPQHTTLYRASFGPRATPSDAEGGYRHARKCFQEHRNRDLEGQFYALEKRSQRSGLERWSLSYWLNWAYDEVAEYGQNYARVVLIFLLLQIIAYQAYAGLAFGRWVDGPTLDRHVGAFTLAQIVKPFELLGARAPAAWFYEGLLTDEGPGVGLLLGSVLHSAVSLTLVALFVLAVRWRFRRE